MMDMFYREGREESKDIRKVLAGLSMMVIAMIVFRIPGIFSSLNADTLDTIKLVIFLLIYLGTAHDVVVGSITQFFNGKIQLERLLIATASFGTFFVGQYWEACAVMFIFMLCEILKEQWTYDVQNSVADMKGMNLIRVFSMICIFFAVVIAIIPPLVDVFAYGAYIKDFNGVWREWVYRGLICLTIACPCTMHIAECASAVKAKQNFITALMIKCIVLVLTTLGFSAMWVSALSEGIICAVIVINMRRVNK